MSRRYAEDTKVPVSRSQEEIKTLLRKVGADQFAVFESDERSAIAFRLGAGMYRIAVPIDQASKNIAQDHRRAWRLLGLLLKAKLEAIRDGASTVEREFLADRLLHDGQTVSEWVEPELQQAQIEGRMPRTLMLEGPKP